MTMGKSTKVLIVDDVPINCMILSSLLASNGVSSDIASGGRECLAMFQKNRYDLILLDHRMPEIDGVDTLMQLKEIFRKTGRAVPVVCHTTEDGKNNINLYKAAGFADVLIKPIEPKKLSDILMTYLSEDETKKKKLEENRREEEERVERELRKLPDWLLHVEGIYPASGIEHCETAEDYLDALKVYASSIEEKAEELEKLSLAGNVKLYTLKVHSLKSMSRLIGAEALSNEAAELEAAGKRGDAELISSMTPVLLEGYRAFLPVLTQLLSAGRKEEDSEDLSERLPEISEATLNDAYQSIGEFASCYDADSIQMVLDSLRDYRLSSEDEKKMGEIQSALDALLWANIREILPKGEKGV